MNGEGEGQDPGLGGEPVECQFPLAIAETCALYGMLYAQIPKGGYEAVLQETSDHLERMEIHADRRFKAQAHAALVACLMEDMRLWLIEHIGEVAVLEHEKVIDEVKERQGH